MTRKEFVKICGLLGISAPFGSLIQACSDDNDQSSPKFQGKVLIIGAGPAGMSAGYLLAQKGIDFEILEAQGQVGGRIRHNTSFSDFPIPLGAEWMHVADSGNGILDEIVNDASVNVGTQTLAYDLQNDQSGYYDGNSLILDSLGNHFGFDFADKKFIGSSWLDFFQTYVLPSIQSKITFNTVVTAINYTANQVSVSTQGGTSYTADKVIVAVPVKLLQNGAINFNPALPSNKQEAIDEVKVWSGFKAFFKFSSKFYPTYMSFPNSDLPEGQLHYYDAAYAQNTNDHILGLFSTGLPAELYQGLSGSAQRDYILNELDSIFGNNVASNNYIDHIVQNWNAEPFANGAYVTSYESWTTLRALGRSVADKLYFAGDAYTTGADWSSVHAAARSASRAVEEISD